MSKRLVDQISRRRFLKGAAGFSLALPALPSLMLYPRGASAATGTPPKRFISVLTTNGQRYTNLLPLNSAEPEWRVLDAANQVRDFNLVDLPNHTQSGGMSLVLPSDLNAVRSKMNIIRGLDMPGLGGNHRPSMMLNAWNLDGYRPTIDQILAHSSKVYPAPPPKGRHLHVCLKEANQGMTPYSIDLSHGGVPAIFNPMTVFNRFFGGNGESQGNLRTRRKLIIDVVREEFAALRSSTRLSSEDKRRLEDHAAKITDLQARLMANFGTGCTVPAIPASLEQNQLNLGNLAAATKAHIDLIVLAIKCDLIRVVSLQLCPGTDLRAVSFFPGTGTYGGDHHGLSHSMACCDYANIPEYTRIGGMVNQWYAKQFAYLVNQLNSEIEPGTEGTYLDHSLVFWGNEDGCGHGNDVHTPFGMPSVLAGGLAGAINTGKYLDYRTLGTRRTYGSDASNPPTYPGIDFIGRPYNQLLVSIVDAFGLTPAEYEQGSAGIGTYHDSTPTAQYSRWLDSDAKRRAPLPFLRK